MRITFEHSEAQQNKCDYMRVVFESLCRIQIAKRKAVQNRYGVRLLPRNACLVIDIFANARALVGETLLVQFVLRSGGGI